MGRYVVHRLLLAVPVLLGISVVVFLMLKLVPGDPAVALLGPQAEPRDIEMLRRAWGLDRPVHEQYLTWLGHALRGNLGLSLEQRVPVADLVLTRFKNTAILTLASVLFSLALGLTAGIVSATRPRSLFDRLTMVAALFANSMPAFWLGLVLIFVFSLRLGWFPVSGMYSIRGEGGLADLLHHLVLPAITLGGATTAIVARLTRSSMLEVIRQDYVRTARAKGLVERRVVLGHALRNALLPVVTVVGLQVGFLLGGAVLTETVFSWPGVGLQLYRAISTRDIPLIQGSVLLIAVTFVVINLVVDLLYALLDPRIRYA
ncbi:MAG: ABC transporter permease [Armatimonadota bacterium]|nr:ABC transporter permease [Armatimonadota bacterium]